MVTINVNGLSLFHRGSGGLSRASLPDVCVTPPTNAPLPYPNVAFATSLIDGTVTVRADGGHSVAVAGSNFARSVGDEAGSAGGVVSARHLGAASWLGHSFNVFFEGRPAERHTDKMLQNHGNTIDCAGAQNPPVLDARMGRARTTRRRTGNCEILLTVTDANGPVQPFHATVEGPLARKHTKTRVHRQRDSGDSNAVTFVNLPPGEYTVTVTHCCHLQWQQTVSAAPEGTARAIDVQLEIPSLLAEAQAKGRVLYSLSSYYDTSDDATVTNEFGGGMLSFGWAYRAPLTVQADFEAPPPPQTISDLEAGLDHFVDDLHLEVMGCSPFSPFCTPDWASALVDLPTYQKLYENPTNPRTPPPGVRPPPPDATPAQLEHIARDCADRYLRACIDKFKDRIKTWVVFNEAMDFLFNGWAHAIPFWRAWGAWEHGFDPRRPDRIPPCWRGVVHTFEVAHEADPSATLILGDYWNETWDGKHRVFRNVNTERMRGEQFFCFAQYVAKHLSPGARRRFVVGFQLHWKSWMSVEGLRENLARYEREHLDVIVTEMSVKMTALRGIDPVQVYVDLVTPNQTEDKLRIAAAKRDALYAAQAPLFGAIYDVLLAAPNVRTIGHWGLDDMRDGSATDPDTLDMFGRLFNSQTGCAAPYSGGYLRKPAYVAVCESLRRSKPRG